MSKRRTANLARAISIILHPLLFLTCFFFVLLYVSPVAVLPVSDDYKWRLLLIIFVFTCLAPLTSVLIFYTTGTLNNLANSSPRDYRLVLWIILLFYLTSSILFATVAGFKELPFIQIVVGANTFILLLISIISFTWSISLHSASSSAMVGLLFAITLKFAAENMLYPILISIILAGCVMSARLYLNSHTPLQVLAGMFMGFGINFLAIMYLL